jgi:hypothetical protein
MESAVTDKTCALNYDELCNKAAKQLTGKDQCTGMTMQICPVYIEQEGFVTNKNPEYLIAVLFYLVFAAVGI